MHNRFHKKFENSSKSFVSITTMASIAKKYVKLSPKDHVLQRSGMYVGSIEQDNYTTWIFDDESSKMVKRNVKYVAGLYKIFDEILVNAIDHSIRMQEEKAKNDSANIVKTIKINIDKYAGIISIENDGNGVEVVKHPTHGIYVPELIFGNLLTGTNYDDSEEKTVGGQNGIGAKACNIFSTWFEIETVDSTRKLKYSQKFSENMSVIDPPVIVKCSKKPYTIIRFLPDYARFKLPKLTDDMYEILRKRAYDACAVTSKEISVYFDDKKLDYKTFEKYVDLYLGAKSEHTRVYEVINERWEIVASYNEYGGFEQISFVNGIWTIRGGKHVDYILNQIVKKLTELISKKNKNVTVKPQAIRDNLVLFVKSTIANPSFDSQSKETLTTPASKFGSKAEVSDKFIAKLYSTGIVDKILQISELHDNKTLQKTDGKKRTLVRGIAKLADANLAGGSKSMECTLILTEGDSAKGMALGGISAIKARDRYGVFPLKGKLLNVKDATASKIADNEEITNIKKILGLESGKKYENLNDLRYGKVMLLTDQDYDGSHIKGLLFNLFNSMWPSLIKNNTFITSMLTPIVKATVGSEVISFYSVSDFDAWVDVNRHRHFESKFFKGLGTSSDKEAKEYFEELKIVNYVHDGRGSDKSLDLAFNKKLADDRKSWLSRYDKDNVLDYKNPKVSYSEFVDRDLIHFSNYDIERSIPNLVDGLKISQRKILFSCFKRNLNDKEIRVAQLSGYVSEQASYHHGEASLQGAIIAMAQDYVGSNNLNLLMPNGQFGSRLSGGHDAAQPRYIHTLINPVTNTIFRKEDSTVLKFLDDDGLRIEPEFYVPIIPMILINGSVGIGTGFSTSIPCFNPLDVAGVLRSLVRQEEITATSIMPWYRKFKGEIVDISGKYHSKGIIQRTSPTKIDVTELPIGFWTTDFKILIEQHMDKNPAIKSYDDNSSKEDVKFTLHFTNAASVDEMIVIENNGFTKFENDFKLVTSKGLSTTNMYLFNEKRQIEKFDTAIDIIKRFYEIRRNFYVIRKDLYLKRLEYDLNLLQNKIRFVRSVVVGDIVVYKMKKQELETVLSDMNFHKHDGKYEYLLKIPIYNFTEDKVEELEQEFSNVEANVILYRNTTVEQIWESELDGFSKAYETFVNTENAKPKKMKSKKKTT